MSTDWKNDPASQAQKDHLVRQVARRAFYGPDVTPGEAVEKMAATVSQPLTKGQASALLDQIAATPGYPKAVVPASESSLRWLTSLAETRAIFGLGVSRADTIAQVAALIATGPTEEQVEEITRGAWRKPPHPSEKSPLPLHVLTGIEDIEISEGHFAVLVDDVLRFYRIYAPTSGEYQGMPVIRRYASTNELAITPAEAVTALHTIAADFDTAAYRFADEFTCCSACGRQLTDQISRLISVGPTCRGFKDHTGLRREAADVDRNPARRLVYRALRQWALAKGFTDPRTKDDRKARTGQMTASWLASAWSGLPGLLDQPADDAVAQVQAAVTGDLTDTMRAALLAAPADTVLILIDSGVLSAPVLTLLAEHPNRKVADAAGTFFLDTLSAGL